MNFNFFAISGLMLSITALILVFIVAIYRKTKIHLLMILVNVCIALWGFGLFLVGIARDPLQAAFFWKIAHLGGVFIAVIFVHVVLLFCSLKRKGIIIFIYSQAALFLILYYVGIIKVDIKLIFNSFYYIKPADLGYPIESLVWVFIVIYGFYNLFKFYRKSSSIKRIQALYLFIGYLCGFMGGSTHFFPVFGLNIYPFGQLGIAVYSIIVTYAIIRHQLLDISIVIKRTIVYSSLITLITVIYILAVFLTERVFNHMFRYATLPMGILAATVIALIFIPLKNQTQHIIDKYFFKGTLDTLAKERELMHQELMRSERLKAVATLAAGMAHEIKNPLTAIKTFTEHLKEKGDDPEFIAKFERIVGAEIEKINRLVHQLLDFAKPNPLKFEISNINYLLDDTLSLLNNEIIKHKVKLVKKYSELPLIQADPNQLKQAFLNLILNAIEAMHHGGELMIETVKVDTEEKLGVNIKDTGAGIPQKDLPHIFDPFYSTKDTGTGLGLSITHEIIKKHNGMITVESEAGKGTTVRINL